MTEVPKPADSVGSRGRPRDPETDRLILQSTLKLLAERGFAGLSIEGVAAKSGVAKTTIYRRYSTKIDLVVSAMVGMLRVDETPDTGSLKGDLVWMMNRPQAIELLVGQGSTLLGSLLAEKVRNPELLEVVRQRLVGPRMAQLNRVFEMAERRGEIREGVDYRLVGHMLFGGVLAHSITGAEVSEGTIESVVDVLVEGIRPRRRIRPAVRRR